MKNVELKQVKGEWTDIEKSVMESLNPDKQRVILEVYRYARNKNEMYHTKELVKYYNKLFKQYEKIYAEIMEKSKAMENMIGNLKENSK